MREEIQDPTGVGPGDVGRGDVGQGYVGPERSRRAWGISRMFCQGNASRLRLKWSWRLAGDQEGGALVEFALTAPMLLAFVFGLIEVCIALYTLQSLSELAREGSRYAIVHGATCTTGSGASCTASASAINTFVSSSNWPNIGGGTVVVAASFPDGNQNPGSRAQVTVTYTIPFKVAFIPTKPITMSSTSVMYIIQ